MNRTECNDTKKADTDGRIKVHVRKLLRKKGILVCVAIAGVLAVALVWRMSDPEQSGHCLDILFGTDNKLDTIKLLGAAIGAVAIFWNAIALTYRATAQENTAEAQKETADAQNKTAKVAQQDVERKIYNDALAMISNTHSPLARISGVYGFVDLVARHQQRSESICNILCAHVRETTQQVDYQVTYKDQPSNEIQSLLDVLTKRDIFVNERLDFSRAYLGSANLQDSNLSKADLSGANLSGAYIQSANLSEAYLKDADLSGADLHFANLSWAYLKDADLSKADLSGANLSETSLSGADLSGACLPKANLSEARLSKINLSGANIQNANLSEVDLSGDNLSGACLQKANLSEARLSKINLIGANLIVANLSEVDLSGANLSGADLLHAKLISANLFNVNLQGANLFSTDLRGAMINGAQLHGAYSVNDHITSFHERINSRRGKETDLSGAKNVPANINEIADTGILTDEMADEIIRKYDEAIGENKE